MRQKIKTLNVGLYILSIFMILNTNSVYLWMQDKDFHLSEITVIMSMVILMAEVLKRRIKALMIRRFIMKMWPYYAILLFYLYMRVPTEQVVGYLMRFVLFIPTIVLIEMIIGDTFEKNKLLIALADVIYWTAAISLFFWLFGSVLHFISPTSSVEVGWYGQGNTVNTYKSYFGIYYEWQKSSLAGITLYRNCSFFCESPMYSLVLVVALIIELFCKDRLPKNRIFVLVACIITSISTTGVVCLIIAFFLYYYRSDIKNRVFNYRKLFLPVFLIAAVGILYYLLETKSNTTSWIIRTRSWMTNWYIFLKNPFMGSGYMNTSIVFDYSKSVYGQTAGTSNSLASIMAQGGIVLFLIYYYPIIMSVVFGLNREAQMVAFFSIVFAVSFSFTSTASSYLVLLVIAVLYKYTLFDKISISRKRLGRKKRT